MTYWRMWLGRYNKDPKCIEKVFRVLAYSSLPSELWRCWLGGRNVMWPVRNWVVGCLCWWPHFHLQSDVIHYEIVTVIKTVGSEGLVLVPESWCKESISHSFRSLVGEWRKDETRSTKFFFWNGYRKKLSKHWKTVIKMEVEEGWCIFVELIILIIYQVRFDNVRLHFFVHFCI